MQSFAIGAMNSPARVFVINQSRLPGLAAIPKGLRPTAIASGSNLQQYRYYDKDMQYNYTDRRYQKYFDLRYDMPSAWTLHQDHRLKMHFEEHTHQRGHTMFVLYCLMFGWIFFTMTAMYVLIPFPEEVGREGSGSEGYRRWFGQKKKSE